MSQTGLLERQEVAESPELQPNALHFLQSIYGLDKRLEGLTQTDAETLANGLTVVYAKSIEGYDDYYTSGVVAQYDNETAQDLEQRQNSITGEFVRLFVTGATPEEIAETTAGEFDKIDVEIQLNTVAVNLKDLDRDYKLENGGVTSLESILEPYGGKRPDFPGPLRTIPFGRTVLGGMDVPSPEDIEQQEQVLDHVLARRAEKIRQAADDYAESYEFKRAAERRGHDKEMQMFVIGPEDTGEDSEALRKMAWLIAAAVFAEKDGNSYEDMVAHANRQYDYCALAVKHTDRGPVPVGAIHTKVQSEDSLLSIEDIQDFWGQPIKETMRRAGLPDLRFEPNVMDVLTIAVLPEFRRGTAGLALYRQVCESIDVLGIEYLVTVLDEFAAKQLNKMGDGFEKYASEDVIPPMNYRALKKDANKSLPLFCRVEAWKARLRREDPSSYNIMWGRRLDSKWQFDKRWALWSQPYVGKHSPLGTEQLLQLSNADGQKQPILYMDREEVTDQYDRLKNAMPRITMHYAMKCNPDRPLLEHIRNLGCRFEVASFNELQSLIDIGVNPAEVLFSNPVKDPEDIRRAYEAGLRRFAFQGLDELYKLQKHAPGANLYFRVATAAENSAVASEGKFGLKIQTEEQRQDIALLMKRARQMGMGALGIAFHVGSQMETPEAWDIALRQTGELMRTLERYHITVEMLDIGGGFPATGHSYGITDIGEFGRVINKALDTYLPYLPPYLAAEPGRGLVSDAGAMIAEVVGVEQRDGEWWVYTSVGAFNGAMMEALETQGKLGFDMQDSRQSKRKKVVAVTGPSCDSQDTISRRQRLSHNLKVGDRIIIKPAGAYTTSYDASRGLYPGFNGIVGAKTVYAPLTRRQPRDYRPQHLAAR
ncbi:MAG TPA: type III PLP-dependent enzyme [Candidatus Saccharimonadales bacterium]|nr:type III PLP-dependent enzyme [Candidatus Saccharimonadales bacterium]